MFSATGYDEIHTSADMGQRMPRDAVPTGRRGRYRVTLYRLPPPTLAIIVPDGYTGPILVELGGDGDGPLTSGERTFEFRASRHGIVTVSDAPALIRRASPASCSAREAGGAVIPLPYGAKDRVRALRWVSSQGDRHAFMIGTAADENRLLHELYEVTGVPKGSRSISIHPARFHRVFERLVAQATR